MSNQPIGIFDSGVGGLTVMAAIQQVLPNESLLYLGDTARLPYGTKSAETILRYTEECLTFLAKRNVKAIVIACNSASAHAFPYIQHRFHFPILGVIESGVEVALAASQRKNIAVIGTPATIASDIYAKALKNRDPTATITSLACPLFVPLVEEGWLNHEVTYWVAQHYLANLRRNGIDVLILGCTHYPLLKDVIQKVLGKEVRLIDSAAAVAQALKKILPEEDRGGGDVQIYVTDFPQRFEAVAKLFLGKNPPPVKQITL